MKKALKINLSQQIFHIDEDAYDKLKYYLDTISTHFSSESESREIMADIEARISELFNERMKSPEQVVTMKEVNEIIDIMGRPEEIITDDEPEKKKGRFERKKNRRLYRDVDNRVVGGVCSGLAAYFNIDDWLMRLLFVIITLAGAFIPIIVYFLLWIAVPKAVTAAQKLEMRGEKVTVSNIREEYESLRESDTYRKAEGFFVKFFKILGVIIIGLLKFIAAVMALVLIIVGIALIFSAFAVLFSAGNASVHIFHGMEIPFAQLVKPFADPVNVNLFIVALLFIVLIPVIAIIFGLIKAIFRFKSNTKQLGLAALVLWLLALITAVAVTIKEGKNYSDMESVTLENAIPGVRTDTLHVKINKALPPGWNSDEIVNFESSTLFSKEMKEFVGKASVNIDRSDTDSFKVKIKRSARGKDSEVASTSAEGIRYNYSIKNDTLILDAYFFPGEESKWRNQKVRVNVLVPSGKAVRLDKNTNDYLYDVDNVQHMWDGEMGGKTWIMTEEGLSLEKNEVK